MADFPAGSSTATSRMIFPARSTHPTFPQARPGFCANSHGGGATGSCFLCCQQATRGAGEIPATTSGSGGRKSGCAAKHERTVRDLWFRGFGRGSGAGIGVLAGLNVRIVPGATGYLGTNYAGKVAAAHDALSKEDFVFVHVEAPDETSHEGSLEKKIQAIEEFDKNIVGEVLKFRTEFPDLRILVLPDHATPVPLKTHHAGRYRLRYAAPASTPTAALRTAKVGAGEEDVYRGHLV